jgi:hypothetical protein
VFGSEFGGGARPTSRQFPPHTPEGRWLYPTLRASVDELFRDYQATLADLARDWARGG